MSDRITDEQLAGWLEYSTYPDTDETHALVNELARLRELVAMFIDGEDCWFDHAGDCQAHGMTLEPGELCPNAEVLQLLAAWEGDADDER
ncbi:hypothetical protein [Nocardia ignorata]|uniref:Uncharacterized protein n=1 Tax=Nocardia ignorata TaxID=145285 RepID=A0A4R6P3J5_NOCIG|nr:hypothetical protein [Nocardia ignorata]TDP29881.1 hypothetical protein DFR75_112150 [Nocardia ignorata]